MKTYHVVQTDKYYLTARDENIFGDRVILSDFKPEILNKIRDELNNYSRFTELDAIKMYCAERKDNYVFDFLTDYGKGDNNG